MSTAAGNHDHHMVIITTRRIDGEKRRWAYSGVVCCEDEKETKQKA